VVGVTPTGAEAHVSSAYPAKTNTPPAIPIVHFVALPSILFIFFSPSWQVPHDPQDVRLTLGG
jgi:hypothetical protein